MKKTLNIYLEQAYQVIDETKHENLENSTFNEVYVKATKELAEITNALLSRRTDSYFENVPNNVLAFTGNRGTGKTSAMLTFINSIKRSQKLDDFKNSENINESKISNKQSDQSELNEQIYFLPIIDPSSFQPSDSLLGVLLGCIFEDYKERIKENHVLQDSGTLESSFQNVLEDVQTLYLKKNQFGDPRDGENPFYTLSRIGSVSVIKKHLHDLVSNFLQFLQTDKQRISKPKFIALVIDDLDLNVNSSFAIIEDIRRYLNISNLIIICSLRLEQIGKSIEEHYLNAYKNINQTDSSQQEFREEVEQMSNYYIEKLFPLTRNVSMPLVLTRAWLRDFQSELSFHPKIDLKFDATKHSEHLLLEFISSCSGIIFLPRKDKIHRIIPQTLREFANLMKFMYDLTEDERKNKETNQVERLRKFYDYFTKKYPKFFLAYHEEVRFEELLRTSFEYRNHYIISKWDQLFPFTHKKVERILKSEDKSRPGYQRCLKAVSFLNNIIPNNKAHLGDVLAILNLVDELDAKQTEIDLVFLIQTLFTINIQIELHQGNTQNLQSLIGQSLWNKDFVRLIPIRSSIIATDYFTLDKTAANEVESFESIRDIVKDLLSSDSEMILLSKFFIYGNDYRRDYAERRDNMDLRPSNVTNLTFDILQFAVWNVFRNDTSLNSNSESIMDLGNQKILGSLKEWNWFYQLELLDSILTNSLKNFDEAVKNESILDRRSEGNMYQEILLFFEGLRLNLKKCNFEWNGQGLDEHLEKNDFYKKLIDVSKQSTAETSIVKRLNNRLTNPKVKPVINSEIDTKRMKRIVSLRRAFENYINNPKAGDKVEFKAKVLTREFSEFLIEGERNEVERLIGRKNSNRNDKNLRKELAEYCLSLILKLAEKP